MQTNNHKIVDYDAVLDAKFGAEGTPERARAEEEAYAFYSGQILLEARKEAKVTQAELAERIQTTKQSLAWRRQDAGFLRRLHHGARLKIARANLIP